MNYEFIVMILLFNPVSLVGYIFLWEWVSAKIFESKGSRVYDSKGNYLGTLIPPRKGRD